MIPKIILKIMILRQKSNGFYRQFLETLEKYTRETGNKWGRDQEGIKQGDAPGRGSLKGGSRWGD